jgi:hypothetical protein
MERFPHPCLTLESGRIVHPLAAEEPPVAQETVA